MIRFTTRNSKYEVTVRDSRFHIKKFEAINPSDYNAVGQTRVSDRMFLVLGGQAVFDEWHTNVVTHIEDV